LTQVKGKGSPYSITERRVPELIPVLGSQPAGDVNHKPDGRLPLLSASVLLCVCIIFVHAAFVRIKLMMMMINEKSAFRYNVFCQVVQKHYLAEVGR